MRNNHKKHKIEYGFNPFELTRSPDGSSPAANMRLESSHPSICIVKLVLGTLLKS